MGLGPREDRREQKVFEGVKPAAEVCAVPLSERGLWLVALNRVTGYWLSLILMVPFKTLQQGSHVSKLWLVLLKLTAGPGIPDLSSHPGVRVLS